MLSPHRLAVSLFACAAVALTGCGVSVRPGAAPLTAGVRGVVHGGQQPVVGSTIQLYGVGTGGDGTGATPLLTKVVTTDGGGSFDITGAYSCTGVSQVYLTATQGDPGNVGNNPNLAAMVALGSCSALPAISFINVNEVTTVAAVAALAPFMNAASATPATTVASGTNDAAALANAFTLAAQLADDTTGVSPGPSIPAGMSVPVAEINTLADILSTCINSVGGVANDGSACGNLFGLTTVSAAPRDTIAALLNILNNPTLNTTALFNLAPANGPFQTMLTNAPASFAVATASASGQFTSITVPFGSVQVGAFSTQTVGIANTTGANLSVSGFALSGANPGEFAQTNNCPAVLAAGTACQLQVTYSPTVPGNVTALLTVSEGGTVTQLSLSGTGLASSTGPLTFSTRALTWYEPNTVRTVTLTNTGTSAMGIGVISFSSSNYTQVNDCNFALPAGAFCTIYVKSVPATNFTGTMTVSSSDTTDPNTVSLTSNTGYQVIKVNSSGPTYGTYMWPYGGVSTPPVGGDGYATLTYSLAVSGPDAGLFDGGSCATHSQGDFSYACSFDTYFYSSTSGIYYAYGMLNTGPTIYLLKGTAIESTPYFVNAGGGFGNVVLGSSSTLAFSVQNLSLTADTFPTVKFSGAAASDYSLSANNCTGSISTNGYCTVSVTFRPQSAGVRNASLTVTDRSGVQQTAILTGAGSSGATKAAPTVNPTTISFSGGTPVGASTTQPLGIYYAAGTTSVVVRIAGGASSPFSVSPSYCAPDGNTGCLVTITYTAPAGGTQTDTLIATDPATGLSVSVPLSGTGGVAVITPTPTSLNFGSVGVLSPSASMSVVLKNTGTGPTTSMSLSLTGPNASEYTLGANCTSLAVGASCTVPISINAKVAGTRTATLNVAINGSGSPLTIPLTAMAGGTPALSVSPATISFASTAVGASSLASTTITNTGTAGLTISNMTLSNQQVNGSLYTAFGFNYACGLNPTVTLAIGASCTISLRFTPLIAGTFTAQVNVVSNAASSPDIVAVVGPATGGTPQLVLQPGTVTFNTTAGVPTTQTQTVTLQSVGSGIPNIQSISLGGANPTAYSQTNNCPATLPAQGGSCTITVTNTYTGGASTSATLFVNSSNASTSGTLKTVAQ